MGSPSTQPFDLGSWNRAFKSGKERGDLEKLGAFLK